MGAVLRNLEEHAELDALRRGAVIVRDDIEETDLVKPVLENLPREQIRSYVLVPIMNLGRLTGSIFLASKVPSSFGAEHVDIAREVADHLAVAIRQAICSRT